MPDSAAADVAGAAARRLVLSEETFASARAYLKGRTLLTPNERAAGALRGARSENLSLAGLAAERLAAAGWQAASEVVQLTTLRQAVRETSLLPERSTSIGSLGSAVRELLRAGLGRDRAQAERLLAADDLADRTRGIIAVTLRYRELLNEAHTVDPAEALWRAAELEDQRVSLLVAGYPRIGLAELVFLDSVAAAGTVLVLPAGFDASAVAADVLGSRGWQVDSAVPGSGAASSTDAQVGPGAGSVHVSFTRALSTRGYVLPNQDDEVRQVLGEVKRLLDGGVDQRAITVIARDEPSYGPLLAAVAQEFGVPLKLSYSVPVRGTRIGELLAGLGRTLSEGLPFEATARLLNDPLLRALDADDWAKARAEHPSGPAAWLEIAPLTALLAWPATANFGQYRAHLRRLLEQSGADSRFSERETRAQQRLEHALAEYDQSAHTTLVGFLAVLDELLGMLSVSVDPPSKSGVEFHSPLAVFGAAYEHVFILGAAEGVLPAPVSDDPLLDFYERAFLRAHGLPLEDPLEASERETLSFYAAVQTARSSLTMSYPELLGNREQIASPFFAVLGHQPEAPGARPAASAAERLLLTLQTEESPAHQAWLVESRRESDAPPDIFDGMVGRPVDIGSMVFSASQLTVLGQCAFRWFGQQRLRLAEPEEAEEDVSPSLLGSIYHKTLELVTKHALGVVTQTRSSPDDEAVAGRPETVRPEPGRRAAGWDEATAASFRQAAIAHLDEAFTEAQAEVGTPRAASWPLQRREHLEKLTRVINAEDFLRPDTEVVRLEGYFKGPWRGFKVRGYVDRVDDGPRGLVLTDYKTGKSMPVGAKNTKGEPKLDLQLPLYVETAAPAWFGTDLDPVKDFDAVRYFSINGAATLKESQIDEDELQRFVARAVAILQSGDFAVDPDAEQKVCTYCELDAVCRRGPRLARKRQRAAESALDSIGESTEESTRESAKGSAP